MFFVIIVYWDVDIHGEKYLICFLQFLSLAYVVYKNQVQERKTAFYQTKKKKTTRANKIMEAIVNVFLRKKFKTSRVKILAKLAISRAQILWKQRQVRYSHAKSDVIELLKLGYQERALLRVNSLFPSLRNRFVPSVYIFINIYVDLICRLSMWWRSKIWWMRLLWSWIIAPSS